MPDVLIVEDDRVVLEAVAGLCRAEGLEVDETAGAAAAGARLAAESYRLAIVDLMLPDGSGASLLPGPGAGERAPAMVMISGYATIDNALGSFRLGAFDFIPKPFDVAELLGVVRRGLRYVERPAKVAAADDALGTRLFLGRHAWALPGADGTMTLGVAETFPGCLGEVARVELPTVGAPLTQGQEAARLLGPEEVHRVWSPLSGLVVAVNGRLTEASGEVDRDPFGSGWLVRIVAADLELERQLLSTRTPGRRP